MHQAWASQGLSQWFLPGFLLLATTFAAAGCTRAVGPSSADLQRPPPAAKSKQPAAAKRTPEPHPSPAEAAQEGFPNAVVDRQPLVRVLRGDYEPPDTLLIAYEEEWIESLEQIVAAAQGESDILILVAPEYRRAPGLRQLRAPHVSIVTAAQDSPWVRDYGPLQTYELQTGPLWLDYEYAWDRPLDDKLPQLLSPIFGARLETPQVALDGGAVISNGAGLCAITRTSLVDAGFSDATPEELENFLSGLGCGATAIFPTITEETTGHADVVAQFLAENVAAVAWVDPSDNAELSILLDAAALNLEQAAELGDYELQITRVPMQAFGETFYSYVNVARLKTRLLVPNFEALPPDLQASAYSALELALPGISLIPIDAENMTQLGGAIHCITLGLSTSEPSRRLRRASRNALPPARPVPRRRG